MICYRPKLTVWLGKLILSTKKHLKSWTTFWKGWLWRVLDAKPMTPGRLLGPPWKLWGITVQTSYWEGQSVGTRANTFFGGMDKEISEKRDLFVHRSVSENFQWEIFSRLVPTESLCTQDSGIFFKKFTLFWSPEVGWVRPNAVR